MPDHEELEQLLQNREKVLRGLECCADAMNDICPYECPYWDECRPNNFYSPAMRDALALLRGQQEIVRCKDCKHWNEADHDCNIKVGHFTAPPDWFCADGEEKSDVQKSD